eukprot:CAMPEP_0172492130 /NCGR_PEP_ID=MMETSP1066-20121228/23158_1 /TAXON_ID=671091 /ORGANISM="Coscinodiscus wailesii, Strain CCMP2513" /LENGTH=46 /DNA_ID= /DNA_START= /DNA_END= /DNA_ORIENTATION=
MAEVVKKWQMGLMREASMRWKWCVDPSRFFIVFHPMSTIVPWRQES